MALPELVPGVWRSEIVVTLTVAALALASIVIVPSRWLAACVWVFSIMLVVGYLRATASPEPLSHFSGAGAGVLAMAVIARVCRSERALAGVAVAFATLGIVVMLVGLVSARRPPSKFFEAPEFYEAMRPRLRLELPGMRRSGLVNLNALAGTALLIGPLGAALALGMRRTSDRRGLMRVVGAAGLGSAAVAVFVVIVSQSRAAWIATWLLLLPFWLRLLRRWVTVPVALLSLLALTLTAGVVVRMGAPSTFERASGLAVRSAGQRMDIWRQGLAHFRASPMLGIGIGEFRGVYVPTGPQKRPRPPAHAHNIFLQTALDVGLIGLAAFIGLIAIVLVRARDAAGGSSTLAAAVAVGGGVALVAGLLFGLGDAIALGAKVGIFQWLAAGLVLAAWHVQKGDSLRL